MIKCYVKAATSDEAACAAYDVAYMADRPDEAEVFPTGFDGKVSMYEVTITARVMPKHKPARKETDDEARLGGKRCPCSICVERRAANTKRHQTKKGQGR